MAIIRLALAFALLVAVLVAGCQPAGRAFQTSLPTSERDPLPVTLTDESGLVTGIGPAEVDPVWNDFVPAVHASPNDPNAWILSWLGGYCDQDTAVWFGVLQGGYVASVAVHKKFGLFGGCPAAAVPRAIRIATSKPIPVESITAAGGG
jgi:hypothetical protein